MSNETNHTENLVTSRRGKGNQQLSKEDATFLPESEEMSSKNMLSSALIIEPTLFILLCTSIV